MLLSSKLLLWLCFFAGSGAAFMMGRSWSKLSREFIVENTILYMIHNNFIRAKKDENGEWEILELEN